MRSKTEIAKQNDLFRSTMLRTKRHKIVLTQGVVSSPSRETVIGMVRAYKRFTSQNDPHKEHDFGEFEVNGEKYFWKIDYYDENFEYGADPQTQDVARLLTIMLASEY